MRWLALVLLYAFSSLAMADDAFWSAVGGAWAMRQSKDIRMVSEDVQITLKPKRMHVRATFNFLNEGPAQTVTTAFPESMQDSTGRKPGQALTIQWFRAWVDGKRVTVTRKTMPLKSLDEYAQYSAVWVKIVPFAAHGRRKVICEYEAKYAGDRDFYSAYYVLRTGATWKGPIGKCVIHVRWPQLGYGGPPQFTLEGAPISGPYRDLNPTKSGAKWADFTFKDFEPKFDISMMFMNTFWNFRVNGQVPTNFPLDMSGDSTVTGSPSDPTIQVAGLAVLLGTAKEEADVDERVESLNEVVTSMSLHNHALKFVYPDHVIVDGKTKRLHRRMTESTWPSVHIRDVVEALGGTYHYHAQAQRADIRIKW